MTTDEGVWAWSATQQAAAIRAGGLSSRELLDALVSQIQRLDSQINAVVSIDLDRARAQATQLDEERARGHILGPLHGLVCTVKDAIEVRGIQSTGGSLDLVGHRPASDAPAVARLRAAGAVVLGKTNVPVWSGDVQTYGPVFGTTNNPWDLSRTPGGSSGGAAAAVACGFTAFELGTDIAGSIRIPSHFCGVFGLKPSYGVVSQRGYLDHVGGGEIDVDINAFGPITRSAEDLALLLSVLAGPSPELADAWHVTLPESRHTHLAGLRVGVCLNSATTPIDTASGNVLRRVVDLLEAAGAHVTESQPPVDFDEQVSLFRALLRAAIAPSLGKDVGLRAAGNHYRWLQRQRQRALAFQAWSDWFCNQDAFLCPVAPTAAFPHDQTGDFSSRVLDLDIGRRPYADLIAWTGLIGVVNLPSVVVPVGQTATGLPVGIQVVAPYLHDYSAITIAAAIGELTGGYQPPPIARQGQLN